MHGSGKLPATDTIFLRPWARHRANSISTPLSNSDVLLADASHISTGSGNSPARRLSRSATFSPACWGPVVHRDLPVPGHRHHTRGEHTGALVLRRACQF